jgi:hypothetical protein
MVPTPLLLQPAPDQPPGLTTGDYARQGPTRLDVRRTCLGALSEAASVFDAALLQEVIAALGARLRPQVPIGRPADCYGGSLMGNTWSSPR